MGKITATVSITNHCIDRLFERADPNAKITFKDEADLARIVARKIINGKLHYNKIKSTSKPEVWVKMYGGKILMVRDNSYHYTATTFIRKPNRRDYESR